MSKTEENHIQCTLEQKQGEVVITIVSWIPAKAAVIGSSMALKDSLTGEWRDGRWTVTQVGNILEPTSEVRSRINAMRNYRKSTDV